MDHGRLVERAVEGYHGKCRELWWARLGSRSTCTVLRTMSRTSSRHQLDVVVQDFFGFGWRPKRSQSTTRLRISFPWIDGQTMELLSWTQELHVFFGPVLTRECFILLRNAWDCGAFVTATPLLPSVLQIDYSSRHCGWRAFVLENITSSWLAFLLSLDFVDPDTPWTKTRLLNWLPSTLIDSVLWANSRSP